MGRARVARTSQAVVDGVVAVAFGKIDDDGDKDKEKGIGSYCSVAEQVCGCTLVRY